MILRAREHMEEKESSHPHKRNNSITPVKLMYKAELPAVHFIQDKQVLVAANHENHIVLWMERDNGVIIFKT
jgi:hypothetical protein